MYFDSRIKCASSVAVLYAIVMMLISLLEDHSCTILQIWYRFLWKFVPGYILKAITWWRHQMETFSALLAICRGIHRSPVNSPHKGQWRGTLVFSMICAWTNGWVNTRDAGDYTRHRAHYDVTVMRKCHQCVAHQTYTFPRWWLPGPRW